MPLKFIKEVLLELPEKPGESELPVLTGLAGSVHSPLLDRQHLCVMISNELKCYDARKRLCLNEHMVCCSELEVGLGRDVVASENPVDATLRWPMVGQGGTAAPQGLY